MKIYGKIDGRLKDVVSFDHTFTEENYLLVVHPNDTDEWVAQELSKRLEDSCCRGVLLVKGVPRGGLTNEKFLRLKKEYGDRFHASACAVGTAQESTKLSGDLETRFRTFFQHARNANDRLDWSILDPQWPDKLISVYLLAKAMATGSKEAALIEREAEAWKPIWEDAKQEHVLLTDTPLCHSQLDMSTGKDVTEQIARYLHVVAARVS